MRKWVLAAAVMLTVARTLVPSEAVAWLGDGQTFVMLWLGLAALVLLAAFEGRVRLSIDPLDVAVLLLVALHVAAALWNRQENPRPTMNMLWEWVGLGLGYFCFRWLLVIPREMRAVVAVMLGLAVVLSTLGLEQVLVSMPADREAYRDNPDAVLRTLGQWYPPGSPERQAFESRLSANEPLATFALTNSLAGYLGMWLVVGAAIWLELWPPGKGDASSADQLPINHPSPDYRSGIALAVFAVPVAACLWMTHSRSALVAVLVGIAGVGTCHLARSGVPRYRLKIGWAMVVAALVAAIALVWQLRPELLVAAARSFQYRLEYWQATLRMIRDHPWLGVGPGNFQDFYTAYKLPQASEEVRDPHNFILEVWSTAGTPAALVLLAIVAWLAAKARGAFRLNVASREQQGGVGSIFLGAAGAFVLAHVVGALVGLEFGYERLLLGLPVGAIAVVAVRRWVERGGLPTYAAPLGILMLLVHLLAAGGIAYPGLAGSLWLLAAITVNQSQATPPATAARPPTSAKHISTRVAVLGVPACIAGMLACYFTSYGPVMNSSAALARAERVRESFLMRERALLAAAEADPKSDRPWQSLAELYLARSKATGQPPPRAEYDLAVANLLTARPRSASTWRLAGSWRVELHKQSGSPLDAAAAARYYRAAVDLYPTSAALNAEAAMALATAGRHPEAKAHAAHALELDSINPHKDKKLSPELRAEMTRLASLTAPRKRGPGKNSPRLTRPAATP